MTFKPGTYVIDTSDSRQCYTAIYQVIGESFDRSILRYIGNIVNGRLTFSFDQPVTHRTTAKLMEW